MKFRNLKYGRLFYVSIITLILISIVIIVKPLKRESKNNEEKFWLNKTFAKSKYNIVIIGDSRAYRGISPTEMQKYLKNKKILNFGYSSARLSSLLFDKAEKKFSPKSNNKIMIIAVTPNSLLAKSFENEHLSENLKMAREKRYEILYFNNYLKYFEPIRGRDFKKDNSPKYIEEYYNDGWIASNKIPEDTSEAIIEYKPWFQKNKVSEKLINNLIAKVKNWENQGITVYGFYMPTSWSMKKLEYSLSGFNEDVFSKQFTDAGGNWLKFNKNYHSYDGSHLDKKSAIEFSKDLANKIKK